MNQPKLSIIVPVYNVEDHLEKCLDSLVNQTFKDIEIIVVNDESPDNSHEIIDKFAKDFPNIIKPFFKSNGGIAETRNFGLSKVQGEYFGFVDSDDYIELDMFEKMYDKAIENNSDIVVSNFLWEYPTGKKKSKEMLEGPYYNSREMIVNLFATLWNKIYKTELIREIGLTFPQGLRYEDASFLYRLAPHINQISFVDDYMVHYVQHSTSITHTHNHRVKDMIFVFDGIIKYYKNNDFYDKHEQELEYIFIKFFLGNSFLRTVQIKDKFDRNNTLKNSFDLLNNSFPNWKQNYYLNNIKSMKHKYYKTVNQKTYNLYAKFFRLIKK